MWPTLNRKRWHQDWCKARVYTNLQCSVLPGNILDYEENRHRRDHMYIHRITRRPRLFADDIIIISACTQSQRRTHTVKLRNWSVTQRKLDFMSTKTKPKQCETTVKQQTQSDSKNKTYCRRCKRVHILGRQSVKIWRHRGWNQDKDRQGKGSLRLWRTSGRRRWSARKQRYAFSGVTYMLQSLGKWLKEYATWLKYSNTKCLRWILQIVWPNKISNAELHEQTGMLPISLEVKKRRWMWIGHVNRMPPTSIPRVAMRWTPAGNRRRGRPKETWRRSVDREMKALGWSLGQVAKLAADRTRWHPAVSALCASTHEED